MAPSSVPRTKLSYWSGAATEHGITSTPRSFAFRQPLQPAPARAFRFTMK